MSVAQPMIRNGPREMRFKVRTKLFATSSTRQVMSVSKIQYLAAAKGGMRRIHRNSEYSDELEKKSIILNELHNNMGAFTWISGAADLPGSLSESIGRVEAPRPVHRGMPSVPVQASARVEFTFSEQRFEVVGMSGPSKKFVTMCLRQSATGINVALRIGKLAHSAPIITQPSLVGISPFVFHIAMVLLKQKAPDQMDLFD